MPTRMRLINVTLLCVMTLGVLTFVSLPHGAFAQDLGVVAAIGSSTSSTDSISSHSGFSATGTGTPSVSSGLSASASNGTAEAGMIAISQQGTVGNMTTVTEYTEYIKASGAINNFDVGFQYQSQTPAFQTPAPWNNILSSPAPFGASGTWQPFSSTGSAVAAPAPWHLYW